jgi:hypothetical protein
MPDIIQSIKELAHKASEDYLLFGKSMNETLISAMNNGEIENPEILKRICEQANQNVYLSLFHSPNANRSNITFELADFNKIMTSSRESEQAMKDYKAPPKDFRSDLEMIIEPIFDQAKEQSEKTAELREMVGYRQKLKNFLSSVEMMKTSEMLAAERFANDIARDAKVLVARGETFGDIAKIAARHVKEQVGGDFMKVAELYDMIGTSLKDDFHINNVFTKLSSQRINERAEFLIPVRGFSESIAKIAGLSEMEESLKKRIASCDKVVG